MKNICLDSKIVIVKTIPETWSEGFLRTPDVAAPSPSVPVAGQEDWERITARDTSRLPRAIRIWLAIQGCKSYCEWMLDTSAPRALGGCNSPLWLQIGTGTGGRERRAGWKALMAMYLMGRKGLLACSRGSFLRNQGIQGKLKQPVQLSTE